MSSNAPRDVRRTPTHATGLWLIILTLALALFVGESRAAAAEKVVGSGTAGSCTEAALRAAIDSGGSVSFNCGGPVTIQVGALIEVAADTTLDGGGLVTLSGGGTTRIFYVNKWEKHNGLRFELRNMTLTGGVAGGSLDPTYGGCIYARRSVTRLVNVTMRGCQAPEAGGALYLYGGEATIEGGLYAENSTAYGGAIHGVLGATLSISGATFNANRAKGDGGAIYMGDSSLTVQGATFTANEAEGTTGLANAGLGGAIYTNKSGATATIAKSSFTGNQASESGGAIFGDYYTATTISDSTFRLNTSLPKVAGASGNGGAIGTAESRLTLNGSELRENRSNSGGAIFNGKGSTMTVRRSVIVANSAVNNGGGIYNIGGNLTLEEDTVSGNVVGTAGSNDRQGGGLISYSGSTVYVLRSTISGNQVLGSDAAGGGIFVSKTQLKVELTTITGNSATRGGGLWHNSGTSDVVGSTIANNSATGSGANIGIDTGAPVLASTLVSGGSGSASCNKAVSDQGHNIQFPGTSCGASIRVADPLLGLLANNGGPTGTMALTTGSPAVDSGDASTCSSRDQRGYSRQGACDIGAFEYGSDGPPNLPNHIDLPLVLR